MNMCLLVCLSVREMKIQRLLVIQLHKEQQLGEQSKKNGLSEAKIVVHDRGSKCEG